MHNLRAPLSEPLKKDKDCEWTPECQETFVKIKEVLTLDLFLAHFNSDLDIIVASDPIRKLRVIFQTAFYPDVERPRVEGATWARDLSTARPGEANRVSTGRSD